MNNSSPIVLARKPAAFEPVEIDDFVALVLAGGEVEARGLKDRVLMAESIAVVRTGSCLLGVGGLKHPSVRHRDDVSIGSGIALCLEEFPFELGWIFILPGARQRKLSLPLCKSLVDSAADRGIFATSRITNIGMHRTLEKLGFARVGREWRSQRNPDNLVLFVRNAA